MSCLVGAVLSMSLASGAWAGEADLSRAKDAYDRGVRAHAAGDHATAARAFAEADALAPTMASLEAALEAAMRADDAVLGAELLERSDARPDRDASLSKSIDAARKRFAGRTGTIHVDCRGADRCLVSVDGRAYEASRPVVALVGPHTVIVQRGDERFEKLVQVTPGAMTIVGGYESGAKVAGDQVAPALVSPGPEQRKPSSQGISPVWFWIGAGATVLSGAAATLSGLDALHAHDEFVAAGCAPGATGPRPSDCNVRSDEGAGKTLRTSLLLGVTGLLAINTVVLGAVFVRWSSAPVGTGGVATIGGRLP